MARNPCVRRLSLLAVMGEYLPFLPQSGYPVSKARYLAGSRKGTLNLLVVPRLKSLCTYAINKLDFGFDLF